MCSFCAPSPLKVTGSCKCLEIHQSFQSLAILSVWKNERLGKGWRQEAHERLRALTTRRPTVRLDYPRECRLDSPRRCSIAQVEFEAPWRRGGGVGSVSIPGDTPVEATLDGSLLLLCRILVLSYRWRLMSWVSMAQMRSASSITSAPSGAPISSRSIKSSTAAATSPASPRASVKRWRFCPAV